MYNLPYYKEKNQQEIMDFIAKHPFALIAGVSEDNKPVATQIPVFMEEREGQFYMTGHMMKQTDHHKAFEMNPAVLCVFTGPHTYVSATWYKNPHQASTWNYMSVHVKGDLRFLDDEGLIDVLKRTSLYFENNDRLSTTIYDNLPEDYTSKLMKAIVAFEIRVVSMDHVFKLSQNRDQESYHSIIEKLGAKDEQSKAIAAEMQKRAGNLFPSEGQ